MSLLAPPLRGAMQKETEQAAKQPKDVMPRACMYVPRHGTFPTPDSRRFRLPQDVLSASPLCSLYLDSTWTRRLHWPVYEKQGLTLDKPVSPTPWLRLIANLGCWAMDQPPSLGGAQDTKRPLKVRTAPSVICFTPLDLPSTDSPRGVVVGALVQTKSVSSPPPSFSISQSSISPVGWL